MHCFVDGSALVAKVYILLLWDYIARLLFLPDHQGSHMLACGMKLGSRQHAQCRHLIMEEFMLVWQQHDEALLQMNAWANAVMTSIFVVMPRQNRSWRQMRAEASM